MSLSLRVVSACLFAVLALSEAAAEPYRLAPYKDELFRYPTVLASEDDGDFVVVEYLKERDLYGRDEIPERRAKPQYVTLTAQHTENFAVEGTPLKFIGVGKFAGGAKVVVIYVHGQGGDRYQGANEWTFGGNFSRVMNLMQRNGGAYLSPDFSDLGEKGKDEIKALLLDQATRSPGAPVIVACGSQGGSICWRLARDPEAAPYIGGLLLLGSGHDDAFLKSAAAKGTGRRFPIYVGHGTLDTVFDWSAEAAFYRRVKTAVPGYPIRFALFDTGSHGTPIRMTDWRLVLNWMLEVGGK